MADRITLIQTHEIELNDELKKLSNEELFEYLNGAYDYQGKNIVLNGNYEQTILSEIDDEDVYIEDGVIGSNGQQIILEGLEQCLT